MHNDPFNSLPTIRSEHARSVAVNIAANARTFCGLLVLIALAVYLHTGEAWFARIAVLSTALVGFSCLVDMIPAGVRLGMLRIALSLALYASAALIAGSLLILIR